MGSLEINSSPTTGKHISVCHVNLGYEENLEEVRTGSPSSTLEFDNTPPEEDQSTLRAEDENRSSRDGKVAFRDDYEFEMLPVPKLRSKAAVIVRDAVKGYGSGTPVLNNFCMTVEKGTIYSLLGSSGCGKTTLLSCVVGIKHLNSGEISVFGAKPGTKESGIPGKRVGYMPQEMALYLDFSIMEALRYFGTLYGMPQSEIKITQDFLIGFLDLPDASRRIGSLSGGQKRRVSLALSLIHSPELLILDEPTVGVDPLLRESIWNHLCKLVSSQATTVIITTHYIEEARQSDMIGLMRGGRLLAEKSPDALLKEHNTVLLEEIVLKLCRKDVLGNYQDNSIAISNNTESEALEKTCGDQYVDRRKDSHAHQTGNRRMSIMVLDEAEDVTTLRNSMTRIRALVQKNVVVLSRNLILLLFMVLVPSIQVLVVCLAIGNDPSPMKIGIVNYETNFSEACLTPKMHGGGCDVENLSCQYLSKLPNDTVVLKRYETEDIARDGVKAGHIWGFMTFPKGYSDNVYTRSSSGNIVDDETLVGSQVPIEMDMSNKQIAATLKRIFYDAYKDFVTELLIDCGFHPELGDSPLKYRTPIFGTDDTDFKEYVAPSVLLSILLFFPLCSSAISFIWDKKQGTLERSMVAGVQTWEIMTAFFVTEVFILIIQASLSFTIVCVLFGIVIKGSFFLAFALAILMGLTGVSLGFFIASFCNEEIEAAMLAMASFFPNFLLAGIIWPVEGMPIPIQYFSYFLPCTFSGESIRSIVSRGWSFTHINVWPGFVVLLTWICIFWIGTSCVNKLSAKRK